MVDLELSQYGVDTIKLAHLVPDLPSEDVLLAHDWNKSFERNGAPRWAFQEDKGSGVPYLSFYKAPEGSVYLVVSVSLPAFANSSNAKLLSEQETSAALHRLSEYVSRVSPCAFDVMTAKVWRVDFAVDISVGELLVRPTIGRIQKAKISRFKVGGYDETTAYFHPIGKAKQSDKEKVITFYGKHLDAVAKKFSQADIDAATGNIRAEFRYKTSKVVTRLAKSAGLPFASPAMLFNPAMAESVLSHLVEIVVNCAKGHSVQEKIQALNQKYGSRRARSLVAFLVHRSTFGQNLHEIAGLGYSRSNCYECIRDCNSLGIYQLHEDSVETEG